MSKTYFGPDAVTQLIAHEYAVAYTKSSPPCEPCCSDKPILFSGTMIRALLDGRKVQTRRILKPQPAGVPWRHELDDGGDGLWRDRWVVWRDGQPQHEETPLLRVRYAIGDRLWVREAWRTADVLDDLPPRDLRKTEDATIDRTPIRYEADGATHDFDETCDPAFGRLRPGMFMPRWASRLTLTVTDVRVQQLLDITEEDARAEGFEDGRLENKRSRRRSVAGAFRLP